MVGDQSRVNTVSMAEASAVESSQWYEVAVHPFTGEERQFQADTEEDLSRQIAAWASQVQPPSEPRPPEPEPLSVPEDPSP